MSSGRNVEVVVAGRRVGAEVHRRKTVPRIRIGLQRAARGVVAHRLTAGGVDEFDAGARVSEQHSDLRVSRPPTEVIHPEGTRNRSASRHRAAVGPRPAVRAADTLTAAVGSSVQTRVRATGVGFQALRAHLARAADKAHG